MSNFLTLDQAKLNGSTVLLRADLNVPMKNGVVTDTTRLERLSHTLNELIKAGAKIAVLSHFGRPDGVAKPEYSLRPVAAELSRILSIPIEFFDDCIGLKAEGAIKALNPGQVLVLENTRFHPGEEANDPEFAKSLAALGQVFVNDAFSAAHRAHASTEGLAHLLPSYAGRLMQAELDALDKALGKPQRPVVAIVGGSKISTKLDLLNNLISKVDMLVLGGGMANTFLGARGINIGKSLSEPNMYETARDIAAKAEARGCHIMLPDDVVVAPELKADVATQTVSVKSVPADQMILDIGPKSVAAIKEAASMCKTVVWNGPIGAFETTPFDKGTVELAIGIADLTKRGVITSVAGGGDTVAALAHAGVTSAFSYVSTAGGAFLEWMEGKTLPGVAALALSLRKNAGKVIM